MKFIKVILMVLIVGGIGYGAYILMGGDPARNADAGIEEIRSHINSRGQLIDYANDLNVKSIDDIKLFVKEKTVKIEFGNIAMEWRMDEFTEPETIKKLKSIGIEVYKDKKTGKLRVFYNGTELERWVY